MDTTNHIQHYNSIDGLRTIACIGIVMMHMAYEGNNPYILHGFIFQTIIPSFTNFVFLFMVISAFGMCCAYHSRILQREMDLSDFYNKRYKKILPFFALLVLIDLVMHFSKETLYEAIADVSLTYGLFPNNITVIGVGWFLGLIFAFYIIFPFFCVMTENKMKAWLSLFASLILNFLGQNYLKLDRSNIIYSSCFFIAGALIYLYREKIESFKWYFTVPLCIVTILFYYLIGGTVYKCLFVSVSLMIFAISKTGFILDNKFTKFFSSVSMEVYLSHMVMFRGMEKLSLNTFLGTGPLQYVVTVIIVLFSAVIFSIVVKWIFRHIKMILSTKLNED